MNRRNFIRSAAVAAAAAPAIPAAIARAAQPQIVRPSDFDGLPNAQAWFRSAVPVSYYSPEYLAALEEIMANGNLDRYLAQFRP